MTAAGIVPALNELEDRHPGFGLGPEFAPVVEFAFEGGAEALANRIVISIAGPIP